jgi:hypothetical protein
MKDDVYWEHPPYSPDMGPRDYDLFAKMTEPLRGTRYNTREMIRAVGRSLLDINRSGRADGVRRLPQIWQKVVSTGVIVLNALFTSGNKSFQNYRSVATIFIHPL